MTAMKRKGDLFKKTFIFCIVLLLLVNGALLAAQGYFGNSQYIKLERERLNRISDEVQELFTRSFEDRDRSLDTFRAYLDAITTSDNISYVIVFPEHTDSYLFFTNIPNYRESVYVKEVTDRLLSGEHIDMEDFQLSDFEDALCSGRPLYTNKEQLVGCVLLFMEISDVKFAFSRLSSSLWITALCLLPVLLITAYVFVSRLERPIREMTAFARRISRGDLGARIEGEYTGEISLLANTMNSMSDALGDSIRQLEYEKQQLGYILSSFSEGVAAIDCDGKLTHYNPALMKMFGAIEVHTPLDLVPDASVWEAFQAVLDSMEPRTFHYNLPGDRILWISIVPVMSDKEHCIGAVGLFKDATEIEQLERMRNDYVANISHELRTPLTSLRGLLEPLTDGMIKDDATKQRYYAIMLHEVERLSRLITDMLQLSRLQSGTESMDITYFNINDVIDDVVRSFSARASENKILLEVNTNENISDVMSDSDRIEQVLVILIDNALRYADSTVKLVVTEDSHDVFVSVWDDGCGISQYDITRLFERFYKTDHSRKEGGTGLGLSIAKQIMDQLEERLEVESVEGEWTCFRFTVKKYVSNAIPLNSVQEIILQDK